MSDQPHRLDERHKSHWLDQPNRLDLPLKKRNQPHRLNQNHRPDLPLKKRDQPHQPDLTLEQLDQPRWLDLPRTQDHLDKPHGLDPPDSESGQSTSRGESVSDDSPGSSDSPADPQKICYTCAQYLPASQFRFRNRATGVRMTECRTCYNKRTKDWHRKKRAREKGWDIHKTASQIARSTTLARTLALLENLVDVMGGPEKLIEQWHNECWKLTTQKRSSTRLARMHEMLIVLMGQTHKAKHQHAAASQPKAAG